MNNVNETMFIPLYGKAYVSKMGIILHDTKAEEIWNAEAFALKGKSKSKWLAYYMGMRSAVFDRWLNGKIAESKDAVILHIGCGMDSRAERVDAKNHLWFDIDFPEVISERRRYYQETEKYTMVEADVRSKDWLANIPRNQHTIIVMEGVSMYLKPKELHVFLKNVTDHFQHISLLMDCYTNLAAKASKYKNPINDVGVTTVYGLDDPKMLEKGTGFMFVKEHEMTPEYLIQQLTKIEKWFFKRIFAGKLSKNMYRLYEYENRERLI